MIFSRLLVKKAKRDEAGRFICPKCGRKFKLTSPYPPVFLDFKSRYDGVSMQFNRHYKFKYFCCIECGEKFIL